MVREERLELSQVTPLEPKSSASTNSATLAFKSLSGKSGVNDGDSNPRPSESQSDALPTELRPPLPENELFKLRLAGFEPATLGLEGRCSIQMSYRRIKLRICAKYSWSGQRDLNPRHSAPKADALPGCAMPRHSQRVNHT